MPKFTGTVLSMNMGKHYDNSEHLWYPVDKEEFLRQIGGDLCVKFDQAMNGFASAEIPHDLGITHKLVIGQKVSGTCERAGKKLRVTGFDPAQ